MLNGLDLFSGIGGLSYALADWIRPVAYCEIERYARGVLLSRMSEGQLSVAPIWDDVKTLHGRMLPSIDIIYGGFPCQDISVAGLGKGLEGKRSGLFFEIMRLVGELRPSFIFLENVPAITSRGLREVTAEITKAGFDCRWTTLSAAEVGANHRRERWWLLAYANSMRKLQQEGIEQEFWKRSSNICENVSDTASIGCNNGCDNREERHIQSSTIGKHEEVQQEWNKRIVGTCKTCSVFSDSRCECKRSEEESEWTSIHTTRCSWWAVEPNVGRVANGIPNRVDRIKGLGNAVVPQCAKEAFKELMGLKELEK